MSRLVGEGEAALARAFGHALVMLGADVLALLLGIRRAHPFAAPRAC
jgi:hypothetical protein